MLIMQSCKTTQSIKLVFPPTPQRIQQTIPTDEESIARLLIYYEQLVQEWELWGQTVKQIADVDEEITK